ncbi:hypothetical protein [Flagellimonas zhangzhouensis]|uniref:Uncharacterized protein n=1 Tax=Flagellimonas zhangzhouensis TaxID=1073328 RepID=A0A1H2YGR1_9FLAO|nr:hypothetical protein [Allomuricauda zhangzhouensis]SDQ96199.1 hypothetical protein SAMN05216294_2955 [Allomuricauda zhangzhouensis]SDX03824.1 hypothetical protein SAMN04487892_3066 [Allomuricauda zhangzhouensis]
MEITLIELKRKIGTTDQKFLNKVYLLANGMVKVHGYDKEKAVSLAIDMATDWFNNGGKYSMNKL